MTPLPQIMEYICSVVYATLSVSNGQKTSCKGWAAGYVQLPTNQASLDFIETHNVNWDMFYNDIFQMKTNPAMFKDSIDSTKNALS